MLRGTLAADDQRVVFMDVDRVVCLDRKNGKVRWSSESLPRAKNYPLRATPTLVLYEDVVLFAGGEFAAEGNRSWDVDKDDTLTALSAETGKVIWTRQLNRELGFMLPTWHFSRSPLVVADQVILNMG